MRLPGTLRAPSSGKREDVGRLRYWRDNPTAGRTRATCVQERMVAIGHVETSSGARTWNLGGQPGMRSPPLAAASSAELASPAPTTAGNAVIPLAVTPEERSLGKALFVARLPLIE